LFYCQTRCAIFHLAAYMSESNFARPTEFIPERWMPDAPAEFRNDKREALQPFMVGPRGCLGKQ
jgi:cytochrome P450